MNHAMPNAAEQHRSDTATLDDTSYQHRTEGSDRAKQKADATVDATKQKAAETRAEFERQAAEMGETAKQKARETAEYAKQSGVEYAREKKLRLADEIGVFSDAIRKASSTLHAEQHDSIANYVDAAAEQLECCQQALRSKDVDEIVDDLQDITRRRPEIVYGGLFMAGLAAMRFLKASNREVPQHHERDLHDHRQRPASAFGHAPDPMPSSPQPPVVTQSDVTVNPQGGKVK